LETTGIFYVLTKGSIMDTLSNDKMNENELSKLIKESQYAKKSAHITKIFLRNITKSLPQYIFWKDTKSVYLGCNQNFAHFVGLNSPEEIIGKTDHDLQWQSTGHTDETFLKGDQDTLLGHPITNQEETLVSPSGKTLITLVSKLPIIDNNEVLGIVGYFTDITEIKQKEIELVKAKQQAEIANQAKSTFVANISHDIRTPLAGMIGMTKIILKASKDKQHQEAASNLLKAENILLNLLNEVISLTKLDSGKFLIRAVKFSMKTLIDNLTTLIMPSIHEKKLDLTIQYDKNIPRHVIGDETRIHRILLNIVSNAIKFTNQGDIEIAVNLAKEEERHLVMKISIKDTGIGIPLEKQQVIFSRFTRLDPSYKETSKGFGLGLSIVKKFISEIDGEIYVDSKKNQGSKFTCVIPLKKVLLDEEENISDLTSDITTIDAFLL